MKLNERIAKDLEIFRTLNQEEKKAFLWDYYKIPILAVVIVAALTVITLVTSTGSRHAAMYAVFVNTSSAEGDRDALDALLEDGGVKLGKKHVDITADLHLGRELNENEDIQTVQVLAALFGISGLDFFASDEAVFEKYAVQDAFADLNLLVDHALLEAHKDDLWYCENTNGERILAGIRIHGDSALHRAGYFTGDALIGVAASAQNMEEALIFLCQLLR